MTLKTLPEPSMKTMFNVAKPDSRKYLRYELLDYAMALGSEHRNGIRVVIADVGLGGLSLRSKEKLMVGERLEIMIGRGDGTQQLLRAVVRHTDYSKDSELYATGVQFVPETHEERLNIAVFVNEAFLRLCESNAS
jgi:hypothetical protein